MRIVVLGGTRFIGRTIVGALVDAGHQVLVCHRGENEPGDLPPVDHLHCDRSLLSDHRSELATFGAEAVVDCLAMSAADAEVAYQAFPDALPWVVLSSMDVYRAFAAIQHARLAVDSLPVTEASPLREDRYPYPTMAGREDYSKRDVEDYVLARGACVIRLPMVYGPHDWQRREEFVLRRVRAGRRAVPVGLGNAILPFAFVADVAHGVSAAVAALAAAQPDVAGQVFNLVEAEFEPVAVWMQRILDAAASDAELVQVADDRLPPDMELAAGVSQPMVASAEKARRILGYRDTPRAEAVSASVAWHLAHPPAAAGSDLDFSADDRALA